MRHLYQIRKDLHKIPETAFKEFKTTSYILKHLENFPELKIHTFPFTGVLVEYSGGEGDYSLFRADMDALPIEEKTDCDFMSGHHGFMHACGHDIHMTVLIGLIEHVVREKLSRNLLFLFQPAEEGFGGAEKVLETGILDKYPIKEVFALHVHPVYPIGTIVSNQDILLGIPQEFDVKFKGRSAHAAHPEKGNDTIAAACSFYQSIYLLLHKRVPPMENHLCHLGKIEGGRARNIVAEETLIQGTLRTLTRETMDIMKSATTEAAKLAAEQFGTSVDVEFLCSYDPVINSPGLFRKLENNLPEDIRLQITKPALLGEDFGFFTTRYEGLMFWVGTGTPEIDVHSPYFLPREESIDIGLKVFISLLNG